MPEVEYFGHKIGQEGLQPTESKVRAVADASELKRVAELRSFLGLVNYYVLPLMASAQIQRWDLTLSAYAYTTQYKAGKDHANTDGHSRLPQTEVSKPAPPVSATHIRQQTHHDPTLSKVRSFVQHG